MKKRLRKKLMKKYMKYVVARIKIQELYIALQQSLNPVAKYDIGGIVPTNKLSGEIVEVNELTELHPDLNGTITININTKDKSKLHEINT